MIEAIGLITARGGSKGIPRKNLVPVCGKPLIAWTIEAALKSEGLSDVILSTDDEEIACVGREWGARVPFMRPAELAQDDSTHFSVVEHAIHWLEANRNRRPEYFMLLQPTCPMRTASDIDDAIRIAETHAAVGVVSVCEMKRHPYLFKKILEDGTLVDFLSGDIDYLCRQNLPTAFALNGAIYLIRCEDFLAERVFWPRGSYAYVMPPERSLDIDSLWDFHLADLILRDRNEPKSH